MGWNKEDDPNGGFKNLYLSKEDYAALAPAVKAEMVVGLATGEGREGGREGGKEGGREVGRI